MAHERPAKPVAVSGQVLGNCDRYRQTSFHVACASAEHVVSAYLTGEWINVPQISVINGDCVHVAI
jgi:hypothetical protein